MGSKKGIRIFGAAVFVAGTVQSAGSALAACNTNSTSTDSSTVVAGTGGNSINTITGGFSNTIVGGLGGSFVSAANIGAGLLFALSPRLSGGAQFQSQVGQTDYISYTGSGTLRYAF